MEDLITKADWITIVVILLIIKTFMEFVMKIIKFLQPKDDNKHLPPCAELKEFKKNYRADLEIRHAKELKLQEQLGKIWADIKVTMKSVKYLENSYRNGNRPNGNSN